MGEGEKERESENLLKLGDSWRQVDLFSGSASKKVVKASAKPGRRAPLYTLIDTLFCLVKRINNKACMKDPFTHEHTSYRYNLMKLTIFNG